MTDSHAPEASVNALRGLDSFCASEPASFVSTVHHGISQKIQAGYKYTG